MPLSQVPHRTPFFEIDPKTGKPTGQISQVWTKWLLQVSRGVDASSDLDVLLANPQPVERGAEISAVTDLAFTGIEQPAQRDNDIRDMVLGGEALPPARDDTARDLALSCPVDYPNRLVSQVEELRLLIDRYPNGGYEHQVIQDSFANRSKYPAAGYVEGSLFCATDAKIKVVWQARQVSGAMQWVYLSGTWSDTLTNIPTASLGTNDAGLLFWVTDYSHMLSWGGATWGPSWGTGNPMPSGKYDLFEAAPAGDGANAWALCNGATVARLNPDGTTTNVTLDDATTPPYLKGGLASSGITAASGDTGLSPSGISVDNEDLTPTTDKFTEQLVTGVDAITGFVNPHPHGITEPNGGLGHLHGPGNLELRNLQKMLYYRR